MKTLSFLFVLEPMQIFLMIKIVIASCLLIGCQVVWAKSETLGAVYPIVERDALEEITASAEKIQDRPLTDKPPKEWSALQPYPLPVAASNRVRAYIPWYVVPEAIKDPKGKVVYPKGFKFNPLIYTRIPNRLVVASERTLPLVEAQLRPTDQLILCQGDLFGVGERLARPTFILQRQLKERLGLTHQPVIVEQVGEKLLITEIAEDGEDRGH